MKLHSQEHLTTFFQTKLSAYLDYLQQMVSINSYTTNPTGVNQLSALTEQLFSTLGFLPEYIQSENPLHGKHLFLKRAASSSPGHSLALISHLDTVFSSEEEARNNFSWRQENDRIYGPGVVDIKGGTIMIYMILDALKELAPQQFASINWFVCLDASEETLSEDFGQHCIEILPTDTLACLVFEGGSLAGDHFPLVVSRKGRATFRIDVSGRSAHAGNAHHRGANAILQISHTIQTIAAFTEYKLGITYNVGKVKGGSVINRVPHQASAKVEMRAFSSQVFEDGIAKMIALNGSSQISSTDGYPCQVKIQLQQKTNPWPRNKDSEALYNIWQQTGNALGFSTKPEERGGLSDGNMLWQSFPVLDGLGPTGANAHCSEHIPDDNKEQEYVVPSSFVPKAVLNTFAIHNLLNS